MSGSSEQAGRFKDVRLRAIEPADLPALYEIQRDPEGNAMAMVIPRNWETFEPLMQKILVDPSVVARAILGDGSLVGSISRFRRDGLDWVGYWIAREHWGKGAASRALALLLQEVATRPLYARVASTNPASLRVLEGCGFIATTRRHSPATERFLECEEVELRLT